MSPALSPSFKKPDLPTSQVKNWIALIRANFLVLTIVVVGSGVTAATYYRGSFDAATCLLTFIGALLAHIAVNVLNNYFDYRSGIDARTIKTPFSGGVEVLFKRQINPSLAHLFGLLAMSGAGMIGLFFLIRHFWVLLPIILYGAISIYLYTPLLTRIPAAGEVVAGSGFGLMALGAYVVQVGVIDPIAVANCSVVGLLVGILLFLNEFPDLEADRAAGRRHIVILLGTRRSSRLYGLLLAATYLLIIGFVLARVLPFTCLVAFASLPLSLKASRIARTCHDDVVGLSPALGMNVLIVLLTIGLLSVGFLAAMSLRGS